MDSITAVSLEVSAERLDVDDLPIRLAAGRVAGCDAGRAVSRDGVPERAVPAGRVGDVVEREAVINARSGCQAVCAVA